MRPGISARIGRLALTGAAAAALAIPAAAAGASTRHAEASAPRGLRTGVVVHGRWQLVVRRPNGSVVGRHTFENSYDGGPFLADVLARQITVGLWEVKLEGTACPSPCMLGESGTGDPGLLTTTWTGGGAKSFSVSGHVTTPDTGTITSVASLNDACANTVDPSSGCAGSALGQDPFTATTVAGVKAHAGDSVAVTVTFSVSTTAESFFAIILSRNSAVGYWWDNVWSPAGCPTGVCQVTESGATNSFPAGAGYSTNLTPSVSGNNLVLTYSVPASAAGSITDITIFNEECSAADPPSSPCGTGSSSSGWDVKTPSTISGAGQYIDVTLTFAFS